MRLLPTPLLLLLLLLVWQPATTHADYIDDLLEKYKDAPVADEAEREQLVQQYAWALRAHDDGPGDAPSAESVDARARARAAEDTDLHAIVNAAGGMSYTTGPLWGVGGANTDRGSGGGAARRARARVRDDVIRKPGWCAMYGQCDKAQEPINICPNNTRALVPTWSMADVCPEFQDLACCNEVQFESLKKNIARSVPLFGRCPACYRNLVQFWCAYTCSPDQSLFVDVLDTQMGSLGKPVVNNTLYTLSHKFSWGFFDACDNVRFGSTGLRIMKFIFGASNPLQFFQFMGHKSAETSPYQIDFHINEAHHVGSSMDYPAIPCDTPQFSLQCSCTDCPTVCPSNGSVNPASQLDLRITYRHLLKVGDNLIEPVNLAMVAIFHLVLCLLLIGRSFYVRTKGGKYTQLALGVLGILFEVGFAIYCLAGKDVHLVRVDESLESLPAHVNFSIHTPDADIHVIDSYLSYNLFFTESAMLAVLLVVLLLGTCIWYRHRRHKVNLATAGSSMHNVVRHQSSASSSSSARPYSDEDDDTDTDRGRDRLSESLLSGSVRPEDREEARASGWLARAFSANARFVARHPLLVICMCMVAVGLCAIGIVTVEIESDPTKLWVPPGSEVLKQQDEFNEQFGKFYRIEQLILSLKRELLDAGHSILEAQYLMSLQNITTHDLQTFAVEYKGQPVTWRDLCLKPIPHKGCVVESVLQYFVKWTEGDPHLNAHTPLSAIEAKIQKCAGRPTLTECRGSIGAPTFPYVVFGGYPEAESAYLNATALIVTYPVRNVDNETDMAEAWEKEWLRRVKAYAADPDTPFDVAFSAQRSVEDELKRGSEADVPTVAISYLVMFIYISVSLGRIFPLNGRLFFVRTRFLLGMTSILVVVLSLVVSVGLVSSMGVKITPIISEVIPFLVLAIGIDNVFIILNNFQARDPRLPVEDRLVETMAQVGTSITLASLSEAFAFLLGGLTRMPAVQAFAFYSAMAIFADFLLQITLFCAILVLDARRRDAVRYDCCPCFRVSNMTQMESYECDYQMGHGPQEVHTVHAVDAAAATSDLNGTAPSTLVPRDGVLKKLMRAYYVPLLMHRFTKMLVMVVFFAMVVFSIGYQYQNLDMGLDQSQAFPKDSYLQDYFHGVSHTLRVGPPVYFVVKKTPNSNFSIPDNQNRVCGFSHCLPNSLETLIDDASHHSLTTYMASNAGVNSWIDDYVSWTTTPNCCLRNNRTGEICSTKTHDPDCLPCLTDAEKLSKYNYTRPNSKAFRDYLEPFLDKSDCSFNCSSCAWGHTTDLVLTEEKRDVQVSRFMSYHSVLKTQADFINAVQGGKRLSKKVAAEQGLDMYPYSVFYVFFDQYEYIQGVAAMNVGLAGAAIFVLCVILLRDVVASLIIMLTLAMILADLVGIMALWSIALNALSTVNIVMAIGISVEFCIHIAVSFMRTPGSRDSRMAHAVIGMGSSVISGITLTKLCGVVVLAFSEMAIFQVYYFRMYFSIVILGFLHGLIFLPVILSLIGPKQAKGGDDSASASVSRKSSRSRVSSDNNHEPLHVEYEEFR